MSAQRTSESKLIGRLIKDGAFGSPTPDMGSGGNHHHRSHRARQGTLPPAGAPR
jgi:hypothetical protein